MRYTTAALATVVLIGGCNADDSSSGADAGPQGPDLGVVDDLDGTDVEELDRGEGETRQPGQGAIAEEGQPPPEITDDDLADLPYAQLLPSDDVADEYVFNTDFTVVDVSDGERGPVERGFANHDQLWDELVAPRRDELVSMGAPAESPVFADGSVMFPDGVVTMFEAAERGDDGLLVPAVVGAPVQLDGGPVAVAWPALLAIDDDDHGTVVDVGAPWRQPMDEVELREWVLDAAERIEELMDQQRD